MCKALFEVCIDCGYDPSLLSYATKVFQNTIHKLLVDERLQPGLYDLRTLCDAVIEADLEIDCTDEEFSHSISECVVTYKSDVPPGTLYILDKQHIPRSN